MVFVVQTATGDQAVGHAAAAAADDGDVNESVMIAVDSSDLRREPESYERQPSIADPSDAAVNLLETNAADVAGVITCQRPSHRRRHQRSQNRDLEDTSCDLEGGDLGHAADTSNIEEELTELSTARDNDDDDDDGGVRMTSRVPGDVTAADDDARCGQLAVESQVAMDTESHLRQLMWRLSVKHLRRNDWEKLARHWYFTDEHIRAIHCHYTGLTASIHVWVSK